MTDTPVLGTVIVTQREDVVVVGDATEALFPGAAQGPPGPKGDTGAQGPPGTVLTYGPPVTALGTAGSIAIDPETGLLYGPKLFSGWPALPFGSVSVAPSGAGEFFFLF